MLGPRPLRDGESSECRIYSGGCSSQPPPMSLLSLSWKRLRQRKKDVEPGYEV